MQHVYSDIFLVWITSENDHVQDHAHFTLVSTSYKFSQYRHQNLIGWT